MNFFCDYEDSCSATSYESSVRSSMQWPISKKSVIKLPIGDRTKPYSSLLVATGSAISFLAVNRKKLPNLRHKDAMAWKCNPDGIVHTLGTATYNLCFGRTTIKHEFHLVHNLVNLEYDGMLGCDFVVKYGCSINFERYLITMNFD
uniref:Peptidase A1 domain-containing protein n=1 Tax=Anopheles melas TaxID=34690 RepID=A0A182TRD2_9DIPT